MTPPVDTPNRPPPSPLEAAPAAWEYERDTRFAAFIKARLAYVDATGCTEERRFTEGLRDVFTEWSRTREPAHHRKDDPLAEHRRSLGWVLRCIAQRVWKGAPGWEPAFQPQAQPPEWALEATT
ncbi:hypothetical protein [Streptomyces chartreusis]|uniref:Uncharacterized protein n=1 Tax=Streptomyces chartreusis TaxID=1969 RepID=A0A7H8TK00_STRCX|nr:hypothetical protein [Streptomyces chartreusis]QKZ23851.1 hypothetical protein HUT05_44745 [Streptomyces chartreusis]